MHHPACLTPARDVIEATEAPAGFRNNGAAGLLLYHFRKFQYILFGSFRKCRTFVHIYYPIMTRFYAYAYSFYFYSIE